MAQLWPSLSQEASAWPTVVKLVTGMYNPVWSILVRIPIVCNCSLGGHHSRTHRIALSWRKLSSTSNCSVLTSQNCTVYICANSTELHKCAPKVHTSASKVHKHTQKCTAQARWMCTSVHFVHTHLCTCVLISALHLHITAPMWLPQRNLEHAPEILCAYQA